jgi:hypothetical protein
MTLSQVQTTLVAVRADTGERLTIGDCDVTLLRTLSEARELRCPHCGSLLTLKAGAVRLHHFAHVSRTECEYPDHESETVSHRLGKYALYRHFRCGAAQAALEYRVPVTEQRADCFVRSPEPDGRSYALEFQQANNNTERWNERRRLYRSAGLNDVWFLGIVRFQESITEPPRPISAYDPLPVPRHEFDAMAGAFHIRELEKAMAAAEGRLYYLDPDTEQLTILVIRSLSGNTVRAYRYQLPLSVAELRDGALWTPLDPLLVPLADYRRQKHR